MNRVLHYCDPAKPWAKYAVWMQHTAEPLLFESAQSARNFEEVYAAVDAGQSFHWDTREPKEQMQKEIDRYEDARNDAEAEARLENMEQL